MWKRENEEREKDRRIGMRLLRAGGEATGLLLLAKSLPLSPAIGCCCYHSINSGGIHHHPCIRRNRLTAKPLTMLL